MAILPQSDRARGFAYAQCNMCLPLTFCFFYAIPNVRSYTVLWLWLLYEWISLDDFIIMCWGNHSMFFHSIMAIYILGNQQSTQLVVCFLWPSEPPIQVSLFLSSVRGWVATCPNYRLSSMIQNTLSSLFVIGFFFFKCLVSTLNQESVIAYFIDANCILISATYWYNL